MLIDPEDISKGRFKPPKKGSLIALNFVSGQGLLKPEESKPSPQQ